VIGFTNSVNPAPPPRGAKRNQRLELTRERVLEELQAFEFNDRHELFDTTGRHVRNVRDLDARTATAIASIEVVTRRTPEGEIGYVKKPQAQLARFRHSTEDMVARILAGSWDRTLPRGQSPGRSAALLIPIAAHR